MESDNEIAKKMLNLKYGEWLDIFTFTKNQIDIIDEIREDKLKDRVVGFLKEAYTDEIEDLIKRNKNEKEANDYVSSLLVMIYNYRLWFDLRKSRKRRARE